MNQCSHGMRVLQGGGLTYWTLCQPRLCVFSIALFIKSVLVYFFFHSEAYSHSLCTWRVEAFFYYNFNKVPLRSLLFVCKNMLLCIKSSTICSKGIFWRFNSLHFIFRSVMRLNELLWRVYGLCQGPFVWHVDIHLFQDCLFRNLLFCFVLAVRYCQR